jgi:hypothetical protein
MKYSLQAAIMAEASYMGENNPTRIHIIVVGVLSSKRICAHKTINFIASAILIESEELISCLLWKHIYAMPLHWNAIFVI